jgi:hypothetical protein
MPYSPLQGDPADLPAPRPDTGSFFNSADQFIGARCIAQALLGMVVSVLLRPIEQSAGIDEHWAFAS